MVDVDPISIDRAVFLRYIFKIHIDLETISLIDHALELRLEPKRNTRRLHNPIGNIPPRIILNSELIDMNVIGLITMEDQIAGRGYQLHLIAH